MRRGEPFICAAVGSVFLECCGCCHRTKQVERRREGQISRNQQLHDQAVISSGSIEEEKKTCAMLFSDPREFLPLHYVC